MTTAQKTITTAALCALSVAGVAGDTLYSCSDRITDKTAGWKFIPSANPGE